MKKLLLTMVLGLMAWNLSAQQWGLGGRIGAGFQAQGEYTFDSGNYVEARFGMSWCAKGAPIMADFTALYQWNVCDMDWTPRAGSWFFDAGAGVGVGGKAHYTYVGPVGCAKLGLRLYNVPLKISFDWTPMFGAEIAHWEGGNSSKFHGHGLANFGVSCVYCF